VKGRKSVKTAAGIADGGRFPAGNTSLWTGKIGAFRRLIAACFGFFPARRSTWN